jgi:hypothetical protein
VLLFKTYEEAKLAASVISFVLNDSVSSSRHGDSWAVHLDVDWPAILYIWEDIRDESSSWDKDALAAWVVWRRKNAGTPAFQETREAAWMLRQSPMMKHSKAYLSPAFVAEQEERLEEDLEDDERWEELIKDPVYQEDVRNSIEAGYSRDANGSWEYTGEDEAPPADEGDD